LAARVRELETRQTLPPASAAASAPPSAPAADAQRLAALEQQVSQMETANATRRGDDNGLPLHGFADVGAGTHNAIAPEVKGFNVGSLDFYLTPRLGDRTLALFELNFEVASDGSVGVDLERAQLGYSFSDKATVWLGRFHTPFGYYNTALHHGNWVANALRRPKFIQFEDHGGILPNHTVGLWLTGAQRFEGGKLLYDLYAGNGQKILDHTVDNGNMNVGGRIGYQITDGAADGLLLGVHALSARINDDQSPMHVTRMKMYGGYAVYDTDQWEGVAEFYLFDNEDLAGGSGTHRSNAGFAQLAYRAHWGIPYVRYERAALQQSDPYFAQQESGASYYRSAMGVRFDLDLKSALKFELANTHTTDRSPDQYNEALVQYAIRF
jgi:hypothetical protein